MPSSASAPPATSTLSLHDALPISLLLSLPGSPVLYYGDEIGMGDNIYLGDRDGVRTPMQWTPDRNAGFSQVDPQRLYLPANMDPVRSEEHTSELQSQFHLVCRLLLPPPPRPPLFPYTTLFRSLYCSPCRARRSSTTATRSAWATTSTSVTATECGRRCSGPRTATRGSRRSTRSGSTSRPTWTRSDRKSTRLNSSHSSISYAVFCFRPPRDLHSFPTRRSSDLSTALPAGLAGPLLRRRDRHGRQHLPR